MPEESKIVKLDLHPNAAKNFNEQAARLVSELAPQPKASKSSIPQPELYVARRITDKDILGDITTTWTDLFGNEIAKFFQVGDKLIGFEGDSYKRLQHVVTGIQRTKSFVNTVSLSLLSSLILNWMKGRYKGNTLLSMTEYVIPRCEQLVEELEIWLPIAMTYTESEFSIGKVHIKPMTPKLFNKWRKHIKGLEEPKEIKAQRLRVFRQQQKVFQGLAAATVTVVAEPKRALEIAVEESEKVISLLRFFSPAARNPRLISYCTLLGKLHIERLNYLECKGEKPTRIGGDTLDKSIHYWALTDEKIAFMKSCGLDRLSDLLKQDKTSFQEKLRDSLLLYSRGFLEKDLANKLVYILVALESLLLRDENEPIQNNIGERIAFIVGKTVDQRRSIIRNVKNTYSARSLFIHHGHSISDVDTLEKFMRNVWEFFLQLIRDMDRYATKEDLIDAIEDRKLS
jgi:hypothetical protein